MYLEKTVAGEKLIVSDDVNYVRKLCDTKQPAILLLTDENRSDDSFGIRFVTESADDDTLTADFCRLVIARIKGEPLTVTESDCLIIRELTVNDTKDIINIYRSGEAPFLESFFTDDTEAEILMEKYIDEVYGFYGYGIWGIYEKSTGEFAGMAGFSHRADDIIELGYAIVSGKRQRGYGYEVCMAVLKYAEQNIDYDKIIIVIDKDNKASLKLADKLPGITVNVK